MKKLLMRPLSKKNGKSGGRTAGLIIPFLGLLWVSISNTWDYMHTEPIEITANIDAKKKKLLKIRLERPFNVFLPIPVTITLPDGSEFHRELKFQKKELIDLVNGNSVSNHYFNTNREHIVSKPDLWELWKLTLPFGLIATLCIPLIVLERKRIHNK